MDFQKAPIALPDSIVRLLRERPLNMAPVLEAAEEILPPLLTHGDFWGGFILGNDRQELHKAFCRLDAHNPARTRITETLYINLHHFPVSAVQIPEKEFSYHDHPWAAAMRIKEGWYEQWIGRTDRPGSRIQPLKTHKTIHTPGDIYSMNDPENWHQVVLPHGKSVWSLMVTYRPKDWPVGPGSLIPRPLGRHNIEFMQKKFQGFYPLQTKVAPEPHEVPSRENLLNIRTPRRVLAFN